MWIKNYDVYDLEYSDSRLIEKHLKVYKKQWSIDYYKNLKDKIQLYIDNQRINNNQSPIPVFHIEGSNISGSEK